MAVTAAHVQDRVAARTLIWTQRGCYQRISLVWADSAYTGTLLSFAAGLGITVYIVAKLADQIGFHVLPRRWVVERTFAWISRCRRTVRDYERRPDHHATFAQWSTIIIMSRRLAPLPAMTQFPDWL